MTAPQDAKEGSSVTGLSSPLSVTLQPPVTEILRAATQVTTCLTLENTVGTQKKGRRKHTKVN